MTSAPSSANRTACERPWPRAAPVMKTTLPSNCCAMTHHPTAAVVDVCQNVRSLDVAVGAAPAWTLTPRGAVVANTEVERYTGVDVEDVPSAHWGWSKENHLMIQVGGILAGIFILCMLRGNHVGTVEDFFLVGFA